MIIFGIDPGVSGAISILENLEDDDDIQQVYANLEIDINLTKKIST